MSPDEVPSALSVVLDDADKIADNLVPPGSSVEKVLGALLIRVADGKPLEPLSDEALGIVPPEPVPGGEPVSDDEAAESVELAELKKENEKLKEEAAAKGSGS